MPNKKLIKEKADFKVLIVYPNLPLMLVPSIAVALFSSILKNNGYKVELFETTHYLSDDISSSEMRAKMLNVREFSITDDLGITIKDDMCGDFRQTVETVQPDLMIFSIVEDTFLQAVNLLRIVTDLEVPHLFGGVFPTNAPERCFDFAEINLVGLGEGENVIVEVAEAIRLFQPLGNILGTWYRDETGIIHKNPKDPLVNINKHTPDFSLFEESRFYRPMGGKIFKMIPVETFRGCPYSCTYCNSPAQRVFAKSNDLGNFLRRKTMGVLHKELSDYVDLYDPGFFYFVDDVFLARPKEEIIEFCDMYEEFKLPFWFNTRSESCEHDVMARLKEVGCYRISFGIECGNEQYRQNVLRRKISNEELIHRFNNIIAKSGIAFSLNVIIGMPGETRELVMDTVELIRSLEGYDALTVSIFTPYHGTVLRDVAIKNGWLEAEAITRHTTSTSILNMPAPYLSADELDALALTFPLYTFFPKSNWEEILRAEENNKDGLALREKYSNIYKEKFLGETQDQKKTIEVVGGSGCRTNSKDTFRISPKRLSKVELNTLMTALH